MSRFLLPILVAVFAILGLLIVVPTFLRELFRPFAHTRRLDDWLDDLSEDQWQR